MVPVVTVPFIITVPVPIEIISFRLVVVALMVSEPAVSNPLPTFIVCIYPVLGRIIDMSPLTVSVLVPEIVRVALEEMTLVNESDEQLAAAVTVTVCPLSIYTTSPATGTDAPDVPPEEADHVEVKFQLPFATEYRVAA